MTSAADSASVRPPSFVEVVSLIPDLAVDLRYLGTDNFVGEKIDGYEQPVCLLTQQAATALAAVQRDLARKALGLKVYDCYRPVRAVSHFLRWARSPDQRTKATYFPEIDKRSLFQEGYLAQRSAHSRGSTVDLTLVQLSDKSELDMGTPFDFFSARSWPSKSQRQHPGAGAPETSRRRHARAGLPGACQGMVAFHAR